MKNQLFKRILSVMLVVALLAGYYVPGAQAESTGISWKETDQEVSIDLSDRLVESHVEHTYAPEDMVRVSIVLEEKSTVQAGFPTRNIARNDQAMAYNRSLQRKQETVAQAISTQALGGEPLDVVWNLTLVGNVISANVPYGKIHAISRVNGVKGVFMEQLFEPCVVKRDEDVAQPQMFSSLGMVGSNQVWSTGYTGAGSRIAVIDTGTDTNHQSLDNGAFLYALEQNAANRGMAINDYLESLDLLDEAEIAAVLDDLNISGRIRGLTAADLYLNEKLAFGANYVDSSLIIDHESDYQGEHGSHVAGIATANRYIPMDGGYAAALDTVLMAGMAPDAQLITMKVFGESGGAYDSDYMSAIEDAILLGCDAVNLSLGTAAPGDGFNDYYADLLDYLACTDTVVVASAGNSYSWPAASLFGFPYSEDVNFDTVGSPGSYANMFAVASVDNDGGIGTAFRAAGRYMFYGEVADYGNPALATMDTSAGGTGTEYDYVFIDGYGYTEDYAGMDLAGKIVFCSRGSLNFVTKANNAMALGAAAVIIYNTSTDGIFGMDLTGLVYEKPCVSISLDDANTLRDASTRNTSASGLTYYTGKMTVLSRQVGMNNNSEFYTMSQFSSWGVPGNLTLKPEITAPGGNIYSLYGESAYGGGPDQYEIMSGTSMAAPAVTGMVALVAQYLKENGLAEQEGLRARTLAQSLLMSTAAPLREENSGGNYYSLLKQGAGLGRVDLAVAADSYILVDGQSDGKVKVELGDDPDRTGVYEFSFSINNLSGAAEDYVLHADVFCQDVFEYQQGSGIFLLDTWTAGLSATVSFTVNGVPLVSQEGLEGYDMNGDGKTDAADADYLLEYLVGNVTALHCNGDVSADGIVSSYDAHLLLAMLTDGSSLVNVPAGGSVTVDVCMVLPETTKQYLDDNYVNGTYVEAFVYAESVSDEEGMAGTVHSIPVLGFYGNWSDPSMFDHSTYVECEYGSVDLAPYLYRVIGCGNTLTIDYGDGNEYYFGGNPFIRDEFYMAERDALNSKDASKLVAQYYTLIRSATELELTIRNADTGEVYYRRMSYGSYPAYYHVNMGQWAEVQQAMNLGWSGTDAAGDPLPDGTNVEVTLMAVPEYYRNEDGSHNYEDLGKGAYMTTPITIDNTAPAMLDMELVDTTLTIAAQDNRYVAAVALMTSSGNTMLAAASPNQVVENAEVSVALDLSTVVGKNFLVAVYDYACNVSVYEVTLDLPEVERPLLTVVDTNTNTYYGLGRDGTILELAAGDRGAINAAEFVDGYVFEICDGDQLYVGSNDDLYNFRFLADLDPNANYGITSFCDLAFNYADDKLYGLFYCEANYGATSVLCTIDMFDGTMEVLAEMPVDVNTLAIDDEGNFYSVGYGDEILYTYTLDGLLASGSMTAVGAIPYYYSSYASSMAWDHDADTLYWGYPNTLLEIDPATATPTLLHYNIFQMVGLYIVPETYGNRFAPVSAVSNLTISQTASRTLVGGVIDLDAQVWPWNVSDDSITWTSSNPAVATVDRNGKVTGVSVGSATITATSNLDPTKSVSCALTVETLEKTLNAVIWDESGYVWWSEFHTDSLPSYTKLTSNSAADYLASTALMPDGTLYAATADTSSGYFRSTVYTVDPDTFELTLVGPSSNGYVDIAPAPHIRGGALGAVYGGNVLFVDTDTGDYYSGSGDIFYMFQNNLVGMAYAGSTYYGDYGFDNYFDWYFLVDTEGYVYLMGWIEGPDGILYYLEHSDTDGGVYMTLPVTTDMSYFCSLYFDGDYLYYSCYDTQKNTSTIYAIDTMGSHQCYELGNVGEGVWPAGGLVELDNPPSNDLMNVVPTQKPMAVEENVEIESLAVVQDEPAASSGGLNAASCQNITVPNSSGEVHEDVHQVVVTLTPAVSLGGSTNGRMTVTYDAGALKLIGVNGTTDAFAYAAENGTVEVAFASAYEMDGDAPVAYLTFEVLKAGEHTISVLHTEDGDGPFGKEEPLIVITTCPHNYEHVVTPPVCDDYGYTTHTCTICGDSYVDSYVDMLGHEYGEWYVVREATWKGSGEEQRDCVRCDHYETRELKLVNPFTDVSENRYYYKPIMWAYYSGITSGKTATTFEPDSTCTRAQVMTFLWAAAGRPEPTSLENPFTDVSPNRYYYKAVLWAVEKGITSGTTATTFSPDASCTRNQVVTFLWVNAGRPEPVTTENPFTDVEAGKYYYKAVLWAYENGITTGRTPTTFEPHSPCTRGQIMTFLYQALAEK